ncbi:uncharacterized protein K441DRAFT_650633 [Cenococcum geophilum 1.58]|uniref:uncharacterized protein n=1 Tax=Cenococcum geophilum 1.58 TaxID=794803 RepID=UPI00358DDBBB|nr:hypothetical protein K441DRAFT_650633 [Cenococcum geophilum 1.58]
MLKYKGENAISMSKLQSIKRLLHKSDIRQIIKTRQFVGIMGISILITMANLCCGDFHILKSSSFISAKTILGHSSPSGLWQ